jgi:hypothetical protein
MKQKHIGLKAGGLLSLITIGLIAGMIVNVQMHEDVIIVQSIQMRSFKPILTADADPGGDNSGFMYLMAYPHSTDPTNDYAVNLSNSSAYEYSDSLNAEMTNETPHSTTFDFVMKFRVNDTVAYNTSSSSWEDTWVRANITVDFDFATDVAADTNMSILQIGNNSDFAWYHAYIQGASGSAGFTITHNEKYNITSVTADGYY